MKYCNSINVSSEICNDVPQAELLLLTTYSSEWDYFCHYVFVNPDFNLETSERHCRALIESTRHIKLDYIYPALSMFYELSISPIGKMFSNRSSQKHTPGCSR